MKPNSDLIGRRFGSLEISSYVGRQKTSPTRMDHKWQAQCDCGQTVILITSRLKRQKSCGYSCPYNNSRRLPSIQNGDRYGNLTVIGRTSDINAKASWRLRCDCGQIVTRRRSNFDVGDGIKSCGCVKPRRPGRPSKNISGQRFGFLLVDEFTDHFWFGETLVRANCKCICDCGNSVNIPSSKLIRMRWNTENRGGKSYLNCGDPLHHNESRGVSYPPTPVDYPPAAMHIVQSYLPYCEPPINSSTEIAVLRDLRLARLFRTAWIIEYRRQQGEEISILEEKRTIKKHLEYARYDQAKIGEQKTIGGRTAMLSCEVLTKAAVIEALANTVVSEPRKPRRFRRR